MQQVNKQKIELMEKRDEYVLKDQPEADSKAIKRKAQNNLNFLFDVIEKYNNASDMYNYDALKGELNILLIRYATIINTRKTHNKKKSV